MNRPSASRSNVDLPLKGCPDTAMIAKLRELIGPVALGALRPP